jgi:hypothetical protein
MRERVASSPAGGVANNVNPAYYYPSQQQYLGYVHPDDVTVAGGVDAVQAASTAIGMHGWITATTRNMALSVAISNVQLVLSQTILPDVISVAAISNAAGSDTSIMASSIHSVSTEIDSMRNGHNKVHRSDRRVSS